MKKEANIFNDKPIECCETDIVRIINACVKDNMQNYLKFWMLVESMNYYPENKKCIINVYNDAKKFLDCMTELVKHCEVEINNKGRA